MRRWRALHLSFGLIGLFAFLATGVYMTLRFPEAYDADQVVRYLYRASHVYILLVSLVHLLLATYLREASALRRLRRQQFASVALLAAVPILVEPSQASPERPLTLVGVVFALAGTVLHVSAGRS